MKKIIFLKKRINKCNGQINFSLKKKLLPDNFKDKLSELKGIKINFEEDFEW